MTKYATREDILCLGLSEGAARLRRFGLRVEKNRAQDPEDMRALAAAFEKILSGADAKKALGLSGTPGRKGPTAAEEDRRELAPCIEVEYLRLRNKGIKLPVAVQKIANQYHISTHTLDLYRKRHLKSAKFFAAIVVRDEDRRNKG